MKHIAILGAAFLFTAVPAQACSGPANHRTILFDNVPANIDPTHTVLKVHFDKEGFPNKPGTDPVSVKVDKTLHGKFGKQRVGVVYTARGSCIFLPRKGYEGILVGPISQKNGKYVMSPILNMNLE